MEQPRNVGEQPHPSLKPRFDPTINLGHILTSAMLVVSVFLAYMNVIRITDRHEMDITQIKDAMTFEKAQAKENRANERTFQAQVLTTMSDLRERMVSIETQLSLPPPRNTNTNTKQ